MSYKQVLTEINRQHSTGLGAEYIATSIASQFGSALRDIPRDDLLILVQHQCRPAQHGAEVKGWGAKGKEERSDRTFRAIVRIQEALARAILNNSLRTSAKNERLQMAFADKTVDWRRNG
jgi:hypothetical protein